MRQSHFSFLSNFPRSLSLYKLRHEPTPRARFSNLKSHSFSGPSQISKIKSEQWKRGPSWKKTKQNKTKETKKQKTKRSPFCLVTDGYVILSVTGNCRNFRGKDPGPDGSDGNWAYIFLFLLQFSPNGLQQLQHLLEFVLWAAVLSNHRWKCSFHINILFKRRLRKGPHFLLISLAFADLLVGLIPVPLFIMIQANVLLHTAYWAYLCVDMITGLSSVFTLTAIYFPRKTTRHFSPSSPSTTHLTQLWDCHSNPMDLLPVVILFALSFFRYNLPSVQLWDNY